MFAYFVHMFWSITLWEVSLRDQGAGPATWQVCLMREAQQAYMPNVSMEGARDVFQSLVKVLRNWVT